MQVVKCTSTLLNIDYQTPDKSQLYMRDESSTLRKVLFRCYLTTDPRERNYAVKIWEAARATSATLLFFKPFSIDTLELIVVDRAVENHR
jgi:hypothetical protein